MELIQQETGITMPIRTVVEYLKHWGFTPQKPLKRAYEQNPKAAQRWLKEEYPEIKARAKLEDSKVFKAWLSEQTESIEVFYLPAYSPELSPGENLNCDLKGGVHSGQPARNKSQFKKKVISHMCMLQKKPARVTKYFHYRKIRYAA
jgi:hypothetical protein